MTWAAAGACSIVHVARALGDMDAGMREVSVEVLRLRVAELELPAGARFLRLLTSPEVPSKVREHAMTLRRGAYGCRRARQRAFVRLFRVGNAACSDVLVAAMHTVTKVHPGALAQARADLAAATEKPT